MEEWRITTWNLQGGRGLDRAFVHAHIIDVRPDVFAIQEITKRQARALAASLDMTYAWARKHTPFPGMTEGMAVLTPHVFDSWTSDVLTAAPLWSWRRRISLRAHIVRNTKRLGILNVHLSPHGADDVRRRELARLAAETAGAANASMQSLGAELDVVVGDFNDELSSATAVFRTQGSAQDIGEGGPPTCWTPGNRIGRPPSHRMDGGIALGSVIGIQASTPTVDLDRWAKVSDHLPVTIDVRRTGRSATPA